MSINRMLEQTDRRSDIKDVHNQLVAAYQTSYPRLQHWPEFNDMRLQRSRDGEAGVYFVADITLPSSPEMRSAEGIIAKMIGMRLLDCLSYFLVQNIAVEDVPDTLKVCLTVCHHNEHWTGVEITLPLFKNIYADFYNRKAETQTEFAGDETSRQNQAKNFVYGILGIQLERINPTDVILSELDKMMKVVEYFSDGNLLLVKHFDSINARGYHAAVQDSMMLVSRFVMFEPVPCAQQRGLTCGDHSVFNLFMSAHMNTIPALNAPGTMTSADLRKLADASLKGGSDVPHAVTLIQSASRFDFNDEAVKQHILRANEMLNILNAHVLKIIKSLSKSDETKVAAIIQYAAAVNAKASVEAVVMNRKQGKLYQELLSLFQGQHYLFDQHNIDADLRLPYGFHAESFALDQCPTLAKQAERASKPATLQQEAERKLRENGKRMKKEQSAAAAELKRVEQVRIVEERLINEVIARVIEDAAGIADTVKKIVKEKLLVPKDDADKIQKLALLCQYKLRKQKEIGALTFANNYQSRLDKFYEASVAIIISDDRDEIKADRIKSVAAQNFYHDHAVKRFFADVALLLSCLIGVGIYIGCKRLAEGKTFFKSSNTSMKRLENDFLNPVLFSDVSDKKDKSLR